MKKSLRAVGISLLSLWLLATGLVIRLHAYQGSAPYNWVSVSGTLRIAWNYPFEVATAIRLNNIRFADLASASGDCGSKITLMDSDLGSNAGQIWISQGCGTAWTSVPTITANHLLRFIQGGTFTMVGDLNLTSGSGLHCDSIATVLKMPNVTGDHNIVTINGANDAEVMGCTLDGTGMTATGANSHLIRVINSSNYKINSNKLINSPEDAIRLGSSTISGPATQGRITNNRIDNPGTIGPSGSCIGTDNVRTTIIDHNQCTNATLDGIDIEPSDGTRFGDQISIVDNYVGGKAGSSNGISLFNNFTATSQQNAVVGNVVQSFVGGTCVILRGQIDDTVTGNTLLGCVNGIQLQTSGGGGGGTTTTVLSSNALKSNTTGIDIDGASSINNLVVGNNINNSTTGITETTSANGNTYIGNKFALNTNNFGTINGNSIAIYDTANGGLFTLLPGQNTACSTYLDAPSGSTHKVLLCPNLSGGAFNNLVAAGDQGVLFNGPAVFGDTANTTGIRFIAGGYSMFPSLFANLGTPANGTIKFCSDCTIANPCAGSGTGALAKRLNSVWVCN